ncbi:glycosyltransferase family 2 protein [Acetobacterium wieringae]|uniref:glycosyltransferase family 2 protein n=1 Tax=Acetobacterium wieringae TaxID=52694 RepID=UPI0020340905|nr:glycosyltransferase family 2 protein [Acetobacterium wieringae]URN85415.1 glycosyltransferase [Acetobacterium wieringae]
MPKITIFTQAYNTEKYIEKCIKSVLNQTFADFEFILVDNGSTDKSKKIIQKYAELDSRIVYIRHDINKKGFWPQYAKEMTKGEYFTNLDSDDWFENSFLETLIDLSEKYNLDMAIGGTKFHYLNNNKTSYRISKEEMILNKTDIINNFSFIYQFIRTVWGKILKTEIIKNTDYSDFYKVAGYGYGGDTAFCIDSLYLVEKMGVTDKVLHNYIVHSKSTSYDYNKNRILSDVFLFEKAENFLASGGSIKDESYLFLFSVYFYAIKDTITVLLNSHICTLDKLSNLKDIIYNTRMQEMINSEYVKSETRILFNQIGKWLLSQEEVQNNEGLDLAATILAGMRLYPNEINGWDEKMIFILLIKIKENLSKMNLSKDADVAILCITSKLPLLRDLNADFLSFFREIIFHLLDDDEIETQNQIYNVISKGIDIPDEYFESFISLGMNLSAKMEQADSFIFFKKQKISLYIDRGQFTDALNELADWDEILPDDVDFENMRKRLTK